MVDDLDCSADTYLIVRDFHLVSQERATSLKTDHTVFRADIAVMCMYVLFNR